MDKQTIVDRIRGGRTDLVLELLGRPNWQEVLAEGPVSLLQWLVYYGDVTALKAVFQAGGDLSSLDLNKELRLAAFFGHWQVCDFLIQHGANVRASVPETGETPLHIALIKAGRPQHLYVVRLLLEHGANVNACTIPGVASSAFIRDVRTTGETPLHRAAAYCDESIIQLLLENGATRSARDAFGDTPMSWANKHLRTASIVAVLVFGEHAEGTSQPNGNPDADEDDQLERELLGDYLPESIEKKLDSVDCSTVLSHIDHRGTNDTKIFGLSNLEI